MASTHGSTQPLPAGVLSAVNLVWNYLLTQEVEHSGDVVVGLGSSDISVADASVKALTEAGARYVVFTGANSKDTAEYFPKGEAEHFGRRARELGVAIESVLIEPRATNTGENFKFTRLLLQQKEIEFSSAIVATRPYHQRRALATAVHLWPNVALSCTSITSSLDAYLEMVHDNERVVTTMVGEVQRMSMYAAKGLIKADPVPSLVRAAARELASVGYDGRLYEGAEL